MKSIIIKSEGGLLMEGQKNKYVSDSVNRCMPEEIEKNLPEKLKKFRAISGLTTNEVGKALNKTPSTITMWEKGKATPDIGTLFKLRKLYGISDLNEFFDEQTLPDLKSLTKTEYELITLWREVPSDARASIKNLLKHIKKK